MGQTAPVGAAGAVVAHETGDDAFDPRAQFHIGLEFRRLVVSARGFDLRAIIADEHLAFSPGSALITATLDPQRAALALPGEEAEGAAVTFARRIGDFGLLTVGTSEARAIRRQIEIFGAEAVGAFIIRREVRDQLGLTAGDFFNERPRLARPARPVLDKLGRVETLRCMLSGQHLGDAD